MAAGEAGKVPVLEVVQAAYGFLAANWSALIPACLVMAAAGAASLSVSLGPGPGPLALASVISVLAGAVFAAAVLRRALRPDEAGGGTPRFGADEFRLIGVSISLFLMFLPLVTLAVFVLTAVVAGRVASSPEAMQELAADPQKLADAIAASMSPAGQMAFSGFILLLTAIALWLTVRLSLVSAATIGERRMVVLQTWGWTKGNLLRVLAAMALTFLPAMLVRGAVTSLLTPDAEGPLRLSVTTAALIGGVQGFVAALTTIPALALAARLYAGLRPPNFAAK
jgi:hypothetical protein